MISVVKSSLTATKDLGHLGLAPMKTDFSTCYVVDSPNPSKLPAYSSLTNISSTRQCSSPTVLVIGAFVDDSPSLSRSRSTIHSSRVATVGHHDTDAWAQEQEIHDSQLSTAAASTSLGFNGTVLDDPFPINVATSFSLMGLQTEMPRTVERFQDASRFCEDAAVHPHDRTSLVALCSGVSQVQSSAIIGPCSRRDISEGRHRVGEILLRCGVINAPGTSLVESTAIGCGHKLDTRPFDGPLMSSATAKLRCGEDELLTTALADWTSEWVYTLVIQPYARESFHFQYQGKSSRAPTLVASRIRRILDNVENPAQVAIHALWFIGALTRNGARDNAPFLSVPIFRYLRNNGTSVAEDFMFRTFVACAMAGDKAVNDEALTTSTWNRLTRIPQAILNATEQYALASLGWNVVMTQTQWQDTIVYLRSCIKMSSGFDPFSYDGSSSSGIMARCLDELISLSNASETCPCPQVSTVEILSPQPIRHFTHWEVFDTIDWCPQDDPVVNQKPRSVGIAPGADQNSGTVKVGTTAKDLLDSILGSRNITDFTHLAQPAGTSFCGSFGLIGARLAHTIRIASACHGASWVHSNG